MKKHLDTCSQKQIDGLSKSLESTNNTNNKIKNSSLILNQNEKKQIFIKYFKLNSLGKYPYNGKKDSNLEDQLSFDIKIELFKKKLSMIKIDWREGCCNLQLSRDNFLDESIKQFLKINIYKVYFY